MDLSVLKAIDPDALVEIARILVRKAARPSVVGGSVLAGGAAIALAGTASVLFT